MGVFRVAALQIRDRSLQFATVIAQAMNSDRKQVPLHLDEFSLQSILSAHEGQVLSDFIYVELSNMDDNITLSENSERRFSDHRGKQDIGVSDDACERY